MQSNNYQKCMVIIVTSLIMTSIFIIYKSPPTNINLNYIKRRIIEVPESLMREMTMKAFNGSNTIKTESLMREVTMKAFNQPHTIKTTSKHFLCPEFKSFGRFANKIFIYASNYGLARSKGMQVYITADCPILKLFDIELTPIKNGVKPCKKFKRLVEKKPAGYTERLTNFTNKQDVQVIRWLQSWRYFDGYKGELRQILKIRDNIRTVVNSKLQTYIQQHGLNNKNVVLVGVHVRRGDIAQRAVVGMQVASKEYLKEAVDWYNTRYKNLLFIAASDDIRWTKQNMPDGIAVSYVEGNPPHIDMAIIGSCNHFIMTVGTFGWWGGWLTGGNVIYYKWPAKKGTTWYNIYNYTDFYPPNWIGL